MFPSKVRRRQDKESPTDGLYCEIDAEPLERYRPGGYHPTHLGDRLNGKYEILHKLGWGDSGTVWLAQDLRLRRHVAIKILLAQPIPGADEFEVLQHLRSLSDRRRGKRYVVKLLDNFMLHGPNGFHQCLVLELLGPNLQVHLDKCPDGRLPPETAIKVSRQLVKAADLLFSERIGHGALLPSNIVLACPSLSYWSQADLLLSLGLPKTGLIKARCEQSSEPIGGHVPSYLVQPSAVPWEAISARSCDIKLVGFGRSFHETAVAPEMRPALGFCAPETVVANKQDFRTDVWSLGCTLFELITGQYPFGEETTSQQSLLGLWISLLGLLPRRWRKFHSRTVDISLFDTRDVILDAKERDANQLEWNGRRSVVMHLQSTYARNSQDSRWLLSDEELEEAGNLVERAIRYLADERETPEQLLRHPWLQPLCEADFDDDDYEDGYESEGELDAELFLEYFHGRR
ncbi:MAG: hypothetical protein M1825_004527 [Sarcosagium campestre]|nr:MAG: hypothetical protein M1825_004527 [Sarcosagium campestre]